MKTRLFLFMGLLAGAASVTGCHNAGGADWSWGWGRPRGEKWTILCVEIQGPDRRSRTEALAKDLRQAKGIRRRDVHVAHGPQTSMLLYGTYYRRVDPKTSRLTVPENLRRDLRLIQGGVAGQGARFAGARMLSSPETDVGDPAWRLENAEGTYTLLVATFENTVDFYDRKKAAVEACKALRRRGYEAYYRHGPITSEVTVGTFGPDALIRGEHQADPTGATPWHVAAEEYSDPVKQLQKKEFFQFLLRNGRQMSLPGEGGRRRYLASRLVPIHVGEAFEDDPW
jgi:hypothetical protein